MSMYETKYRSINNRSSQTACGHYTKQTHSFIKFNIQAASRSITHRYCSRDTYFQHIIVSPLHKYICILFLGLLLSKVIHRTAQILTLLSSLLPHLSTTLLLWITENNLTCAATTKYTKREKMLHGLWTKGLQHFAQRTNESKVRKYK